MTELYQGPEYRSWHMMKQRCLNPKFTKYPHYGGREIKVCERWLKFNNFYEDMGNKPTLKHSIERIDNDGNYEPSNCKWATATEQNVNQRIRIDNKSGHKGIYKDISSGRIKKWRVKIRRNYKTVFSGSFLTKEEAVMAKQLALGG